MPLLFLSHSGSDTEEARELKRRLLASPAAQVAGLRVWLDKDELLPGRGWQDQLEAVITRQSTGFAVYVGSKGVINWVDSEVRLGLSRATAGRYPFIPILAAGVTSSALPPFAAQYHGVRDPLNNPAEMIKLLASALDHDVAAVAPMTKEPFVGLRAMTEAESDRFFGRDAELDEAIEKLKRRRLLAVVADSGSGKSSLVQAGLVPRFRGGAFRDPTGLEPDGRIWHVVVMRPGVAPIEGLRNAVTTAAERLKLSPAVKAQLRDMVDASRPQQLAYSLQCDLPAATTETLLVVDQFEELFTQTPEVLRKPFIDWLLSLVAPDATLGFRVVLTIRSDHVNLASAYPALFVSTLRLKQLSPEGLARIVNGPLTLAGHRDEAERQALIAQIRRDVSDRPGDLALVQMALYETWQRSGGEAGKLVEAYVAVGGVVGALAHAAEDVRTAKLTQAEQAMLEGVLVRLVTLGETVGATRRTAKIEEFDEDRQSLIGKLAQERYERLLLTGEDTVEICHEQLLTQWPWWQNCISRSARDVRRLGRLMDKARDWSTADKASEVKFLATGIDLELFTALHRDHADWLSLRERAYIEASLELRGREEAQKESARLFELSRQRTMAEAASKLAEFARESANARRRQAKVARIFAVVAVCIAMVAGYFWWISQGQLHRANVALAQGVWNNLVFQAPDKLTTDELNSLWSLTADAAVRAAFEQQLKTNRSIAIRFGRDPATVERALGPDWPSSAVAEPLLAAVVADISQTKSPNDLVAIARAVKALSAKLSDAQAQVAVQPILAAIKATDDPTVLGALALALPGKLSDAQAQDATEPVLAAIGATTESHAFGVLGRAYQALAAKLSSAQAQVAMEPVLAAINATHNPNALSALGQAYQALAAKLSEAQAQAAIDPVFAEIEGTNDPSALRALLGAYQVLAAKLSGAQAQVAIQPVLAAFFTNDRVRLYVTSQAYQPLAAKLSRAQAQVAIKPVLAAIRATNDPWALRALAQALLALPGKLSEAHAQVAIEPVIAAINTTDDQYDLFALAQVVQVLAAQLSGPQAQVAMESVLAAIETKTGPGPALDALAQAAQALAVKLADSQVEAATEPILTAIKAKNNTVALNSLTGAYQALAAKLSGAQVQVAIEHVLAAIKTTDDPYTLRALAQALQALPAKLSDAQAQVAIEPVIADLKATDDPDILGALSQAYQALAAKLSDAQAQVAIQPVLAAIKVTNKPEALSALAQALQALPAKLSDAQAQAAIEPVIAAIKATSNPDALQALAQAAQALAAKLSDNQRQAAARSARSALGWASGVEEAKAWTLALVALLPREPAEHYAGGIVEVLKYFTTAGPATDALLDALHNRFPEAPGQKAGLAENLAWIRRSFPAIDITGPAVCPPPLRRDLACPAPR